MKMGPKGEWRRTGGSGGGQKEVEEDRRRTGESGGGQEEVEEGQRERTKNMLAKTKSK